MMVLNQPARCGRCGGNLAAEEDIHGIYVKCIMCSRSVEITRKNPCVPSASAHNPRLEPARRTLSTRGAGTALFQAMMMTDSGSPWE